MFFVATFIERPSVSAIMDGTRFVVLWRLHLNLEIFCLFVLEGHVCTSIKPRCWDGIVLIVGMHSGISLVDKRDLGPLLSGILDWCRLN